MSFVRLTAGREAALDRTLAGLQESGRILVTASTDGTLAPAARGDDPGLFIIVPLVASAFGLDAYGAFVAFAIVFLGLAALSTLLGVFRYASRASTRVIGAVTALGLAAVALKIGDTYMAAAALPLFVVAWLLPVPERGLGPRAIWWALAAGLLAGACDAIRSQAALPLLGFVAVVLLVARSTPGKRRLGFFAMLLAGMLVVQVLVGWQVTQRDEYLGQMDPSYSPSPAQHVLWHSLYVGLGYVSNPWVPEVADDVAKAEAARIDPDAAYLSAEYEAVMRDATLQFVREHPRQFAESVAAKTGVTFMYIALFGIVGLIASAFRRAPLTGVDTAFGVAIFLGALPGMLVYPEPAFIVGALTFAGLWGVYRWEETRRASERRAADAPSDPEARLALERDFHDESAADVDLATVPVLQMFEGPTSPEPAWIVGQFGDVTGKRVLDLGCGAGEATVYFALQGAEVVGLDISPEQCRLAERLAEHWGVSERVSTICSPIEEADLGNDRFDFVYGYGVLHHVDIAETAEVVHRILKPGGKAGFVEPVAYNPAINVYRRMAEAVRTPTEHPLKRDDMDTLRRRFPQMEHREFQFFTLLIYLWMYLGERLHPSETKYWKRILTHSEQYGRAFQRLAAIDRFVLQAPLLRWLCYTTTIILPKESPDTTGDTTV